MSAANRADHDPLVTASVASPAPPAPQSVAILWFRNASGVFTAVLAATTRVQGPHSCCVGCCCSDACPVCVGGLVSPTDYAMLTVQDQVSARCEAALATQLRRAGGSTRGYPLTRQPNHAWHLLQNAGFPKPPPAPPPLCLGREKLVRKPSRWTLGHRQETSAVCPRRRAETCRFRRRRSAVQ